MMYKEVINNANHLQNITSNETPSVSYKGYLGLDEETKNERWLNCGILSNYLF